MTFLSGPNNVGKSNVLLALAIVANKAQRITSADDFPGPGGMGLALTMSSEIMQEKLRNRPSAVDAQRRSGSSLEVNYSLHQGGIDRIDPSSQNTSKKFHEYLSSGGFSNDFGQRSSNILNNANTLLDSMGILDDLKGSTYVPHLRFITRQNEEPPRFLSGEFPGETIAFSTVITRLAELDRPAPSQLVLRQQLLQIEQFIAHCLEQDRVKLEVSHDKQAIIVDIDGEQRSLSSLGTGIEQLIMIGLASMGFPEKLVLIDEPELHLHPRAQKRMLQYLNDHVDAQFVIATHSAAALDAVNADVIQITRENSISKARTITSNSERYEAIRDLGHSPSELLQTRYAIWAEGPSDRVYLNNWINRIAPELIEGVDYTILYYGGSVLAQHSFVETEDAIGELDLVRALSLSRSFAVLIDSDLTRERPNLRETKIRIRAEIAAAGGYCWITDGREVENYISINVQKQLAQEFEYATKMVNKLDQILSPRRAQKVIVAKRAVELDDQQWPLDLEVRVTELVALIRSAR
jgi:predicted ATP-dependent endonuclease of OLD family